MLKILIKHYTPINNYDVSWSRNNPQEAKRFLVLRTKSCFIFFANINCFFSHSRQWLFSHLSPDDVYFFQFFLDDNSTDNARFSFFKRMFSNFPQTIATFYFYSNNNCFSFSQCFGITSKQNYILLFLLRKQWFFREQPISYNSRRAAALSTSDNYSVISV